jgi:hypothetical protein
MSPLPVPGNAVNPLLAAGCALEREVARRLAGKSQ